MNEPTASDANRPTILEEVRSWSWPDRLLVAGAGLLAAYCLLQILQLRFGRDQGIYAVVANAVLDGGMPYREAWDFKPPGIFIVYALARGLFGRSEASIRIVEAMGFAALMPSFALLTRRFCGDLRPGLLGGAIAILIEAQLEFWHTAQPESFGGILTVFAIVLATWEVPAGKIGRGAWASWVGAGLLVGAAGLMKPHLAGAAAVLGVYLVWRMRLLGHTLNRSLGAAAALAIGAAATWGLCLAWFWTRGALGDLHETLFVFAPGYAATTWDARSLPLFLYYGAQEWATGMSSLMALGLLACLTLPRLGAREREVFWIVLATAAIHLVGIALQSKFFQYHYGATLPLGAFLAGLGVWKGWSLAKRNATLGYPLFALIGYLGFEGRVPVRDLAQSFFERSWQRTSLLLRGTPTDCENLAGKLYSVADVDYAANAAVAAWIQANSAATDSVYVWGFEPSIYDTAKRTPATRFIYNVPQRVSWENKHARARLMSDLQRAKPKVIVVEHNDVFPVVTGNTLDSASALRTFPELETLIEERYDHRQTMQDFDIYERRMGD